MCTQCLVNPFYYGEIAPGWFLIRARREENNDKDSMKIGDWGLVECNDPSIVFKTTPFIYADSSKLDLAMNQFEDELITDIDTGYRLYSALKQVKLSVNSRRLMVKHNCYSFNDRFYMYLADYIAKCNPVLEQDPFPHLDSLIEHDYEMNPRLPYYSKQELPHISV